MNWSWARYAQEAFVIAALVLFVSALLRAVS